eukprot:CAMPEP_0184519922 /NCGR_PEP_ID=MMETSP0198_2-20121128/6888_1 /TAXON_ID=1112570 /ORGANISM="Thraustochytrium sp., Strain LLF1b" /LENGTH=568 /DNA_ID=CAMNT_0026910477 /DNA_START=115 /DNA_END=1821 /DNA_ORIENTATION=-
MAGFASSVMLGDLNDFISPSQACVNPIFAKGDDTSASPKAEDPSSVGLPKIGLALENDLGQPLAAAEAFKAPPNLIKTSEEKTAKVSLSDCLACSGCVTSAETVLIEQQSGEEFERAAKSGNYDVVVVTVSRQSRASIAGHFGVQDVSQVQSQIESVLKQHYNVDAVVDPSSGGDLALAESAHEFLHRYRTRGTQGWSAPQASAAVSSDEQTFDPLGTNPIAQVHNGAVERRSELPMLASACPGWICFVEKSHPEAIPYISTTKSPQQIAGALVKRYIAKQSGVPANRVYHATVMPCADKKLEASRKDFYSAELNTNDVDCVLTTMELIAILEKQDTSSSTSDAMETEEGESTTSKASPEAVHSYLNALAHLSPSNDATFRDPSADNGGSGGYLEYVFRTAARELFNITVPEGPLPYKTGRNADIRTVELHSEGKPVLRFASAYGFRNIQTIIRQMKRGKCTYDYIEIMACPGGCLNGGGQARVGQTGENTEVPQVMMTDASAGRKRLVLVDKLFHDAKRRAPEANQSVQHLYSAWVGSEPYSDQARQILHTRYHAVPKMENGLLEKW